MARVVNCGDARHGLDRSTLIVMGYSVRAAVQCAHHCGVDTIAIDLCQDRDLTYLSKRHYSLYDPDWPAMVAQSSPNATLLLCGGMEYRLEWIDRLRDDAGEMSCVFGPTSTQIAEMRKISNWEQWALSSGLGWPKTFWPLRPPIDVTQGQRWLVKAMDGSGGTNIEEYNATIFDGDRWFSVNPNRYLQQYQPGDSLGVTFLSSAHGSVVVGAALAWPPSPEASSHKYLYRGSYGPVPLTTQQWSTLHRFADEAAMQSELHGLWQADLLLHNGELTLLEINPRWSASMDLLDVALDLRLVDWHRDSVQSKMTLENFAAIRTQVNERRSEAQQNLLGKRIVYTREPFVVSKEQTDRWWSHRWQGSGTTESKWDEYGCSYADIPNSETVLDVGSPVLTCMAAASSPQRLFERLANAESSLLCGCPRNW